MGRVQLKPASKSLLEGLTVAMVRPLQGRKCSVFRSVGLHLRLLTVSRAAGLLPFLSAYLLRKERRRNPAESSNPTFMSRTQFAQMFSSEKRL